MNATDGPFRCSHTIDLVDGQSDADVRRLRSGPRPFAAECGRCSDTVQAIAIPSGGGAVRYVAAPWCDRCCDEFRARRARPSRRTNPNQLNLFQTREENSNA